MINSPVFPGAVPKCVRPSLEALLRPFTLRCPLSSPPRPVIVPDPTGFFPVAGTSLAHPRSMQFGGECPSSQAESGSRWLINEPAEQAPSTQPRDICPGFYIFLPLARLEGLAASSNHESAIPLLSKTFHLCGGPSPLGCGQIPIQSFVVDTETKYVSLNLSEPGTFFNCLLFLVFRIVLPT